MNSNNDNKKSQEIDLSYLFSSFGSFLKSIELFVFRSFRFIISNIVVLFILVLIGAGIGYFLDKQSGTTYKHEIIITANFGSSPYLYQKISKIRLDDKESVIRKVEIEPVIDVYSFVSEKVQNLNIARYLSDNNIEISKHKEGNQTELIYKYHLLTLYSDEKDIDNKAINQFLAELNQESYFLERQKIETEQTALQIKECQVSIDNINSYFKKLGAETIPSSKTDLNVEFNAQLNDLLSSKNNILKELEMLSILQLEQQEIFYNVSSLTNIKISSGKKMILIPLLLILIYLGTVTVRQRYKKYKLLSQS